MSKGKGPKKFEDGRQKIDVDYSTDTEAANAAQRKKKKNASILTPVFLLFICIPIAFIVYFWKFYDPSNAGEQAKIDDKQVVEIARDSVSTPKNNAVVAEDDEQPAEQLSDEEKAAAALAAQEAAEKAAKAEADRVAQKVAEEKAAEEERRKAEEKAAEEERRKAEEEELRKQAAIAAEQARKDAEAQEARRQAEEAKKQEQQKQQQQVVRYHTVQPNETLYRISVNYYGSGDAVGRIKAANGLSSNEISVGQTLKLP